MARRVFGSSGLDFEENASTNIINVTPSVSVRNGSTGRRVFSAANGSVSAAAAVDRIPVSAATAVKRKQAVSSVNKGSKPLSGAMNIAAYSSMALFVTGGCVFGYLAFQSSGETANVMQKWNDIRDIANSSVSDSDGDQPSRNNDKIAMPVLSDDIDPEERAAIMAAFESDMEYTEDAEPQEAYMPDPETGEMVVASSNTDTLPSYYYAPMDRVINWDSIKSVNSQVKCWLYVPNTNIDYPVIQEASLGDWYYLSHDFYGKATNSGSIVTAALPQGSDTSAHFMILGHNMRNKTMFGTLLNYRGSDFYRNNPYIYIYYPDHTEKWEVWSVYHTKDTDIIYDIPYELDSVAFKNLVKQINSQKSYPTNIDNTDPNKGILTLSTCENIDGTHTGRFVVNAMLAESKNNS